MPAPTPVLDGARELATEDILRVEIVRAGGPYFGAGSAAGGDHVTVDDLRSAAASYAALRDELWPPVKLGHNDEQAATREEYGDLLLSDGAPALGWLDNIRVEGIGLYADLRKVPKTVAALVRAGAYRARSIEFWRGYRDRAGKRHPMVITGLALLGARLPAVRGLEEMVQALYADAPSPTEQDQTGRRTALTTAGPRAYAVASDYLPLADADRPWDEAAALSRVLAWAGATDGATDGTDAGPLSEPVLARLRTAFLLWDDGGGESLGDFHHLVADVVGDRLRAVPAAVYAAAEAINRSGDTGHDAERAKARLGAWYGALGATPPWGGLRGPAAVPVDDDYYAARQTAGTPHKEDGMDPKEIRVALGLDADATDEAVTAAISAGREATERVTALEADLAAAGDGATSYADLAAKLSAQEKEIATLSELAKDGVEAKAQLYAASRDAALDKAVRERRLTPGEVDTWREKYDAAPGVVSELLTSLPVRADLAAVEQGHDGTGTPDAEQGAIEDAHYAAFFGERPRHAHAPKEA